MVDSNIVLFGRGEDAKIGPDTVENDVGGKEPYIINVGKKSILLAPAKKCYNQ